MDDTKGDARVARKDEDIGAGLYDLGVGYAELANAIIVMAARDYYRAICRCGPEGPEAKTVERFFRSEWFTVLTNANPTAILEKILKKGAPKTRIMRYNPRVS